MPLNLAKKNIKLCRELGVRRMIFIGGEPTLYNGLEELITNTKINKMQVGMVTNGRKLGKRQYVQQLKDCGIDFITISIESSYSQSHDAITKVKGSYEDTVKGLENCLLENIYVTTETTISQINKGEMHNLVSFLANLGLQKVTFNLCSPPLHKSDTPYAISPMEGAKMIQDLYAFGKSLNVDVASITPLPICNLDEKVVKEMLQKRLLNGSCHIFYGTNFVIDYNGDVIPCVHFSGFPLMSLYNQGGNTKTSEEFITEFFDEKGTSSLFRDALWKYPSKKCEEDKLFGKCIGGCPIFWLTKYFPDQEIVGLQPTRLRLKVYPA